MKGYRCTPHGAWVKGYGFTPRPAVRGGSMSFNEQFENVQKKATEATTAVKDAASESRDQLRQRIDEAQVQLDLASKDVRDKAQEAGDQTRSQWAQLKADTRLTMGDVKAKIDKRNA